MNQTVLTLLIVAGVSTGAAGPGAPEAGKEAAADWPCWRGPKGDGVSPALGIRKDFAGGLRQVWEVASLCQGNESAAWSAPAIQGDRLVAPGRDAADDVIFCLDPDTGKEVWKVRYPAPGKVQYGEGPRATPYIDAERVYTFGCMGHLACWRLADGERVWMQPVDALGGRRPMWGHSSSPLVYQDKVIVQAGGKALAIAFNKTDGKVAWKSPPGEAGYAAPVIVPVAGKDQLIVFAAAALVGLDPDTGKRLWSHPWPTAYGMNCTTPVAVGDRLFISSSIYQKSGGSALLQLTAAGPRLVWQNMNVGAHHTDPAIVDGHVYCYSGYSTNDRDLRCLDLATGALKWASPAVGLGTLVRVEGLLMCLSNTGRLALVRPSPKGVEKLTEFQAIPGRPVWTVPVIARGKVYVRFVNRLRCYELKKT